MNVSTTFVWTDIIQFFFFFAYIYDLNSLTLNAVDSAVRYFNKLICKHVNNMFNNNSEAKSKLYIIFFIHVWIYKKPLRIVHDRYFWTRSKLYSYTHFLVSSAVCQRNRSPTKFVFYFK